MERLVDESVDDPLHLVTLEDEHNLICGEIDGVPLQPAFAGLEWRPCAISSAARGSAPLFRRATIAICSMTPPFVCSPL